MKVYTSCRLQGGLGHIVGSLRCMVQGPGCGVSGSTLNPEPWFRGSRVRGLVYFLICAFHHVRGPMLVFSVSFRMITEGLNQGK